MSAAAAALPRHHQPQPDTPRGGISVVPAVQPYGQIPNTLTDNWLPALVRGSHAGLSEVAVLLCIARYTCGFQRDEWSAGVRRIARLTGLGPETVSLAGQALEKRDLVSRKPGFQGRTVWRINWDVRLEPAGKDCAESPHTTVRSLRTRERNLLKEKSERASEKPSVTEETADTGQSPARSPAPLIEQNQPQPREEAAITPVVPLERENPSVPAKLPPPPGTNVVVDTNHDVPNEEENTITGVLDENNVVNHAGAAAELLQTARAACPGSTPTELAGFIRHKCDEKRRIHPENPIGFVGFFLKGGKNGVLYTDLPKWLSKVRAETMAPKPRGEAYSIYKDPFADILAAQEVAR